MTNSEVEQAVLAMPRDERLRLVHRAWESIAVEGTAPISAEERALIDERIREHEANPDDVVSFDEVKAELWPNL